MHNTALQTTWVRSYPQHIHSFSSENLRDPTATCCAQIHRLLQARTEKAARRLLACNSRPLLRSAIVSNYPANERLLDHRRFARAVHRRSVGEAKSVTRGTGVRLEVQTPGPEADKSRVLKAMALRDIRRLVELGLKAKLK